MSKPQTISSYDLEDSLNVLRVMSSDQFQTIVNLYNKTIDDDELKEFIREKKEGFFEKYKTLEEVKSKIAALEKAIRDQERMLQILNQRNIKLSEFIIKHSISERITTKDLVELTDDYQDLFTKAVSSIKEELVKKKIDNQELDMSLKLLNEPPYEEYYNSYGD
jgi:hypothetical protein